MPNQLFIASNFSCNNHCFFCHLGELRHQKQFNSIDFSALRQKISDLPKPLQIIYTGGEPTIDPNFWFNFRALSEVLNHHINLVVETNGRMLSSSDFIRDHLDVIRNRQISWHLALQNANAEGHDFLCQTPGSFKQTLRAMRNLRQSGARLSVTTVLHRSNILSLPDLAFILDGLGVDSWQLNYPGMRQTLNSPPHAGDLADLQSLLPRMQTIKEILNLITLEYPNLKITSQNIPKCIRPGDENIHVSETYFANPNDSDAALWHHAIEKRLTYEDPLHCDQCAQTGPKNSCCGIPRYYNELYGVTEFGPFRSKSAL